MYIYFNCVLIVYICNTIDVYCNYWSPFIRTYRYRVPAHLYLKASFCCNECINISIFKANLLSNWTMKPIWFVNNFEH